MTKDFSRLYDIKKKTEVQISFDDVMNNISKKLWESCGLMNVYYMAIEVEEIGDGVMARYKGIPIVINEKLDDGTVWIEWQNLGIDIWFGGRYEIITRRKR